MLRIAGVMGFVGKKSGRWENRARDLLHPKQESVRFSPSVCLTLISYLAVASSVVALSTFGQTARRLSLGRWWYSVVVSISGCDPLDPGSNPGTAIFFLLDHVGDSVHLVASNPRQQS